LQISDWKPDPQLTFFIPLTNLQSEIANLKSKMQKKNSQRSETLAYDLGFFKRD